MLETKAYATVRVLSLGQRRNFEPKNQAQCKREVEHLEPGPLLEQSDY